MRTSMKIAVAAAGAAVVMVGGTAFTAANTVPAEQGAGYGSTTATGLTVATMVITPAANPVNLASVVYTALGDYSNVNGYTIQLSTGNGVTVIDSDCVSEVAAGTTTVTCAPESPPVTIASITNLGLTATQNS